MQAHKTYLNWSGGKDALMALHETVEKGSPVSALFTTVGATQRRVAMHGVRYELLAAQAAALGLPLRTAAIPEPASMEAYEAVMKEAVHALKTDGFNTAMFGDLFLEDLRRYREAQLLQWNISCSFPLWGRNTTELLQQFIALGYKAIVVCVNESLLPNSFCGRPIDADFLADLPTNVDPCGERGEYHSFVFDGPLFAQPVRFQKGEVVCRSYPAPQTGDCFNTPQASVPFYFQELIPMEDEE